MNTNRYRLIFNELTATWVPVAECVSARGKRSAGRLQRRVLAAACALGFATPLMAAGALPVAAPNFVDGRLPGTATMTQTANQMVIQQTGNAVMLNWNSFNIGRGNAVHFDQASAAMRAINVVVPGGPRSEIDGTLTARGQVFIFNQAGILFGPGANIDVGGLVGSSLKLNDELLQRALNSLGSTGAALTPFADGDYAGRATGDITVARGARILAAKNGRVLLAAPNVRVGADVDTTIDTPLTPAQRTALPDARIEAEEGQVVLAAGERIYIADPLDSRLRGFLVEVDNGGTVTTDSASELLSDRGNITLVGLNIRHAGAARATTSVTLNGTVFLKARDSVEARQVDAMFPDAAPLATGVNVPIGQRTGSVELAAGAVIDISPDTATRTQTARDDALFRRSEINLYGHSVVLADAGADGVGVTLRAPSGLLRVTAEATALSSTQPVPQRDVASRVYIGAGSVIDLAGLDAFADAGREIVRVELRGDEVKDAPLLRDEAFGRALFGKQVWVDLREGTELFDIAGYLGGVERTLDEKLTTGGQFVAYSQGDVLTHSASSIDLSGGTVTYRAGEVGYTLVQSADGRSQSVADARADRIYTGTQDRTRTVAERIEGRDAGELTVTAFGMALDGAVNAQRTVGATQREIVTRALGPGKSDVLGSPQAGRIDLNLRLVNGLAAQDTRFVNSTGTRALSATGALPAELWIRSDWFSSGVGSFELTGAGDIVLPEDVSLTLGPTALYNAATDAWSDGSRFAVTGTTLKIDGDITAAGGDISLRTGGLADDAPRATRTISVGANAQLSAAGQWQRDTRSSAPGYVAVDGGSVTLDADSHVDLAQGSRVDVSAGAWQTLDGTRELGDAGAISLGAGFEVTGGDPGTGVPVGSFFGNLNLGGQLSAFATSLNGRASAGGSLTLRSAAIAVDGVNAGLLGDTLYLSPTLFSDAGFSDFSLTGGNRVDIGGASAVTLTPVVQARAIDGIRSSSADSLDGLGRVAAVPRALRDDGVQIAFAATSESTGTLTVADNATINVDAGGTIELSANRSLELAGALNAPGGRIALRMDEVQQDDIYFGSSLFVASTAQLNTSGTFLQTPGLSYVDGTLFDGGSIDIAARRGYLVIQDGAQLRADGSSAVLAQRTGALGALSAVRIDSSGGRISLNAREGLYADPLLSARAGGANAVGGQLSVTLDQGSNNWGDPLSLPTALTGPRTLDILQGGNSGSAAFVPGAAPDAPTYAGRGAFALDALEGSGIADLTLAVLGNGGNFGTLRFSEDVDASVAGRMVLNAANIRGTNGADVRLGAAVLDWTNVGRVQQNHAQPTSVAAGDGGLVLAADLVQVSGNLAASGFADVTLDARGDLRASASPGYVADGASLVTSGDLTLRAAQVYPTSASRYAFEIHNNPVGTLRIESSGRAAGPVYSALGSLTFAAPDIVQAGRVVAPFGDIVLRSETITRTGAGTTRSEAIGGSIELAAGSVTSVSADGLLLPYGQTALSGRDWLYLVGTDARIELDGTPQKRITLNADNVVLQGAQGDEAAARVDLSGGGDLQAWEWIAGSGGSRDILAAPQDSYAIVPTLGSGYAAYDLSMWAEEGNGLRIGEAVQVLASANGLAAGTYTLLPARYALLPGAFLISLSPDDSSLAAGQAQANVDGSARVSVRSAQALGGVSTSTGKAFVAELLTSEQVRDRAEYLISKTADVFDDGRSTADAGRLSLQVGRALTLEGVLDTSRGATARGAQVDITAQALALLGQGAAARTGEVGVSVASLNALDAESLLLGGTRSAVDEDSGETLVDVRAADDTGRLIRGASTVRLDNAAGPALSAPDVVLVARDSVVLEAGSQIAAVGTAEPEALRIAGSGADADGAALRVSAADAAPISRGAPSGLRGELTLGAGSRIAGRGVVLDSTLETRNLGATIALPQSGGALALTASTINVGDVPSDAPGLRFDNSQLAALGDPSRLTLRAYGGLNLYGEVTLGSASLDLLRIDAAGIGGVNNAGLTQNIVAGEVQFANTSPTATALAPAVGTGALSVTADRIVLDGTPAAAAGQAGFAISGFDAVTLAATDALRVSGDGDYRVLADTVRIVTPQIVADTGANTRVAVDGALSISGGDAPAGTVQAGIGAALAFDAQAIDLASRIALPSGRVSLAATQDVRVAAGGLIDVSGTAKDYLGKTVTTPGGDVVLASRNGDVTLAQGALIDVSAASTAATGGNAGSVTLSAAQGELSVADGALRAQSSGASAGGALSVDVRSAASLDSLAAQGSEFTRSWSARVRTGDTRLDADLKAGDIAIAADAGSLTIGSTLDASGAEQGGRIELSARRALDHVEGMTTGAGDLVLESGARLDARATAFVAEASGTRGEGGNVILEASPRSAGGESGPAQGGRIRIADGAVIDVGTTPGVVNGVAQASAAQQGDVWLRAERTGNTAVAIDGNLSNAIDGARHVFVEGTRIYGGSTLSMSAAHADAAAMTSTANVAATRAALGLPAQDADGGTRFHIRPHIEFRADGNFTINATDLSANTYQGGTEAGSLTVRVAGNLNVNGALSDGFGRLNASSQTIVLGALTSAGLTQSRFDLGQRDTAWSMRLVSGADLAGAGALSLQALDTLVAGNRGDLILAPNAQVRTGAGDIDVAVGRDLVLGARAAIYTAGYQVARGDGFTTQTLLNLNGSGNRQAEYATDGGDVAVRAQRSIVATESSGIVGEWLLRQGALSPTGEFLSGSGQRNTTWYARIDQFSQGVATFGGGDIRVTAGNDIRNLGVFTVTNGRLSGAPGTTPDAANLQVLGGGDVTVRAGGDIGSAILMVDRGVLDAQASGDFGSARNNGAGSVLLLGEASARLGAAGSIDLETIASSTAVRQASNTTTSNRSSYFFRYGEGSRVDLLSYGGSVSLDNNATPWGTLALWEGLNPLLPNSLNAVAMGGDLNLRNGMVLLPATYNDLLLAASGNLNLATASGGVAGIKIADSAPGLVPSALRPAANVNNVFWVDLANPNVVSGIRAHDAGLNAGRVVEPVRLVAETGNIAVPSVGANLPLVINSPQPVQVEAGGDIRNLTLRSQHFSDSDITRVRAGGDITFDTVFESDGVTPSGSIAEGMQTGGRGKLEVVAGGSIDLANSFGIVTRGNFDNPWLDEVGASILVQAGSAGFDGRAIWSTLRPVRGSAGEDSYDKVLLSVSGATSIDDLLAGPAGSTLAKVRSEGRMLLAQRLGAIDAAIIGFMRAGGATPDTPEAQLLQAFDALPAAAQQDFFASQQPLMSALLNAGLNYAGKLGDAIGAGETGYAPGVALVGAAFPQTTDGNINLFFSQVKSEQGGDVNLFAPGGSINVGVAGAGASAASASRQGVFAIGEGEINAIAGGDFQLGPSRVFTLGGGDIQLWSTAGNIDAGRGSRTASATPPPQVRIRGDLVVLDISDSVSGSGIGTLKRSDEVRDADIRLFAPSGAIIALDAAIRSSGNLTIGAQQVIGNSISVGGSLSGSATVAAAAPAAAPSAPPPSEANKAVDQGQKAAAAGQKDARDPNSILTVELVGLGEESTAAGCEEDDEDERCKERATRAN
ncbi:filamentous haemagglutinin family protein [Methyloversatilis sp.]|uniref:filamentous haemagglutinin family protein n=1 Tax=Methyloversatilis sp. TaxID=2569862 RepID=UPI0027B8FECC|nr:filamentous haemagglutinin family protein [Methyloversatilis sp.]